MTTIVAAWQQALAAEHAAVAGYDVLGPRLPNPTEIGLARSSQQAHRDLRDRTAAQLRAAGQTPVAALADYPLPFPVADAPQARQLARRLETACAQAWRYLIAVAAEPGLPTTGLDVSAVRDAAQSALTASAIRAMRWQRLITPAQATVPFPGI